MQKIITWKTKLISESQYIWHTMLGFKQAGHVIKGNCDTSLEVT
jgi:hypothetical protein